MNQIGGMKSVTLGVNIDTSRMVAKEIGVLSINQEYFHSGDIMDRLLSARLKKNEYTCLTPLVSTHVAESGSSALLQTVNEAITKVYKRAFQSFSLSVRNYIRCNTDFLLQIYGDLMFFHKAYQLLMELRKKGYPICKPEIESKQEKAFQANHMYNMVLALKTNEHLVTNNVNFDENGMFYLITGPNHGGKSIFAASIGMVQAMAQLGLYVPTQKARISLVDNIFTHLFHKLESITHLPKKEFMQYIFQMGQTPEEVMQEPELLDLLYEIIYPDYRMIDTYVHGDNLGVLDLPITVFAGDKDDRAPYEDLTEWQMYTTKEIKIITLEGKHFFAFDRTQEFYQALRNEIVTF